jgi:hypothetical protein
MGAVEVRVRKLAQLSKHDGVSPMNKAFGPTGTFADSAASRSEPDGVTSKLRLLLDEHGRPTSGCRACATRWRGDEDVPRTVQEVVRLISLKHRLRHEPMAGVAAKLALASGSYRIGEVNAGPCAAQFACADGWSCG